MSPAPAIVFENVTKIFASITALENLSLEVEPNQVYGLIGPDGAGKTSSMRILATVYKPTSGKAKVFGYDVMENPWPIKSRIGYMPQNFSLYRDLSVSENIRFYAGIYKVPKKKMVERIKWLLDFTGLGPFTERIADALSGGMKQKLALACALIHEPELLLLDEPTTGVDPVARREFWKNLENLSKQGMTVFVSTPYMDEAERCDRIAFVDNGKIVREGSVDRIRSEVDFKLFAVRGKELRKKLREMESKPGVVGAQLLGNVLRVQLEKNYDERALKTMIGTEAEFTVEAIRPSLEDVFAHLLGKSTKKKGGDVKAAVS